ncbi:MAG: hypothetical protein SGPRY_010780, partial [Prymnesium sp.]
MVRVLAFLRSSMSEKQSERELVSGVPPAARQQLYHEFKAIVQRELGEAVGESGSSESNGGVPRKRDRGEFNASFWSELVGREAPALDGNENTKAACELGNQFTFDF